MGTGYQYFLEIGGELPKEKCEIDIFKAGFCDMKFMLITFTTSSI